jgi:hypothetical protein
MSKFKTGDILYWKDYDYLGEFISQNRNASKMYDCKTAKSESVHFIKMTTIACNAPALTSDIGEWKSQLERIGLYEMPYLIISIIPLKDIILFSHWKNKTDYFWELLKR